MQVRRVRNCRDTAVPLPSLRTAKLTANHWSDRLLPGRYLLGGPAAFRYVLSTWTISRVGRWRDRPSMRFAFDGGSALVRCAERSFLASMRPQPLGGSACALS